MRALSAERSMNYESAKGWVKFQLLEFPQAVEKMENVCESKRLVPKGEEVETMLEGWAPQSQGKNNNSRHREPPQVFEWDSDIIKAVT